MNSIRPCVLAWTAKVCFVVLLLVAFAPPSSATTVYFTYTEYLQAGQVTWQSDSFDTAAHPTTITWHFTISPLAAINGEAITNITGSPNLVWLGDSIESLDLSPLTLIGSGPTPSSFYSPLNDHFPTGAGTEQPSFQTATDIRVYGNLTSNTCCFAASAPNTLDGQVPEPASAALCFTGLIAVAWAVRRRLT